MYEIGQFVVYRQVSVCKIEGVETPSFESDRTKTYYKLSPVFDNKNATTIYVPMQSLECLRPILSKEEGEALLREIPNVKPTACPYKKPPQVTAFYQDILASCDLKQYVALLKEVSGKSKAAGKKASEIDMRFRAKTERLLSEELATALQKPLDEIKKLLPL